MTSFFKQTWVKIILGILCSVMLIIIIGELLYLNRTYSEEEMRHSIVKVEHLTGYALCADGKDLLFFTEFSEDGVFVGLDTLETVVLRSDTTVGIWVNSLSFFPSCEGTLLAYDFSPDVKGIARGIGERLERYVEKNRDLYKERIRQNKAVAKEVKYYLSVHNLMDGEYADVLNYSTAQELEYVTLCRYAQLLDSALGSQKLEIRPISRFYVSANGDPESCNLKCSVLPHVSEDEECVSSIQYREFDDNVVILQTESMLIPESAFAVSFPLLTSFKYTMKDTVNVPKFGSSVVERSALHDAFAFNPMFDDSRRFLGFVPSSCHHLEELDTLNYTFLEKCKVDSLVKGTFTDSLGTYTGQMTIDGLPCGMGVFRYNDGGYYEGEWKGGLREGNGFYTMAGQMVKAGEWMTDAYKGERMVYNANRVYGIDISRYQHEIGRRKYGIDWKNLRITYLGAKNSGDASDSINYPVSFVYIKSTQGTTIKSKYYAADSRDARKYGIMCGAYHFFSLKTSALEQAKFFLKNTHIAASDMPPVLDVEPTDAEIRRYGGEQKMFESIRTWVNHVESKTDKRPILYVSQKFIKNHLVKAPDLCNKYQVWIARYGAYRPEVKLLFWQLTPYGRVKGITGDVDINVFNGYRDHFSQFEKSLGRR